MKEQASLACAVPMGPARLGKTGHEPNPATPKPRLIGLDVLRFVAVTLVLHIHAVLGFGPVRPGGTGATLGIRILDFFDLLLPGIRGVDIFFVLSGFLVSGLFFQELAQTGAVLPGRFLLRRGFKIYPAFWLLIVVTTVIQFLQTGRLNGKGLLAEFFFFQNYVTGLWLHTWTLALEEHFYLLLACLFFALKRFAGPDGALNLKVIPRVVDTVILSCLAARILTWWFCLGMNLDNQRWFGTVTHVRIDALFFGMWLAHLWYNCWGEPRRARVVSFRYLWAAVGLVLISRLTDRIMNVETWHIVGFILVYVGAGSLLLAALSLDYLHCPACFQWLAWLGKHSYSVYLWHMLVLAGMQPFLGKESSGAGVFLLKEFLYFSASWISGIIMAQVIEFPMLRLRDRLFPKRGGMVDRIASVPAT